MKLLTRQEVIEIWSNQTPEFLNAYVCSNCRDILDMISDSKFVCINMKCAEYDKEVEAE
jgi:hypothetical protein